MAHLLNTTPQSGRKEADQELADARTAWKVGERDERRLRVGTRRNCCWCVVPQELRYLFGYLMGIESQLGSLAEYTFEKQVDLPVTWLAAIFVDGRQGLFQGDLTTLDTRPLILHLSSCSTVHTGL